MEITKDVILRAWREEEYFNSLPEATRKQIPARPTGENGAELPDAGSCAAGYGIGAGVNALTD